MDTFYAHTDPDNSGKLPEEGGRWHLLKDHLEGTAALAEKFAAVFGAGNWGYLAGLWHDSGKFSIEFQQRLRSSSDAHIEQHGRVDHSTYGAQMAASKWNTGEGKTLAYIIAGHHGGLPEGKTDGQSCLANRIEKSFSYSFHCPKELFDQAKPVLPFGLDRSRFHFELSFFVRMLFSCLTDGDFLDTEKHMAPNKFALRPAERDISDLAQILDNHINQLQRRAESTTVNKLRARILSECRQTALQQPGLFSLTVPTGGGKTLSSMAFALTHGLRYGHKRIIYVIPYTSIIEQNARVFRDVFGDDAVLEHHSNYEPQEEDSKTRLASENWDSPIVVTTNVQFFESLFACRGSRCRKLHNIAQSVIILDEIQALPSEFLLPCLEVIRELTSHYQCSIVLCSATQPAVQHRPDFLLGLQNIKEITSDPVSLYQQLKRVGVQSIGRQTDEELIHRLNQNRQVLCIVNTRKHANILFEGLVSQDNTFHLSASMYPLHRSRVLEKIKAALNDGKPCRVISTQLVEAGVDIDFPVVYRAMAGLDSIAQAAGRCNREGRLDCGQVFVFESENPLPPGYFRHTAQTAEGVIRRFSQDMLSLEAIEEYFKEYYWKQGERLDKEGILDLIQQGAKACDFPFRTVAEKFKLIAEENKPVIIPCEPEAQKLIEDARNADTLRGFSRRFQKYTVQINPRNWNRLMEAGAIEIVRDIFPVLLWPNQYDEHTGLNTDDPNPNPNDLIC